METKVTIYLDKRYSKKGNIYPVKIRVWNNLIKKAKLYETNFNFSEKEFASVWENKVIRKAYQENNIKLHKLINKARDVVDTLDTFTFEAFEKKWMRKTTDATNVFWYYEQKIANLKTNKQFSTAIAYDLSVKSIIKFLDYTNGKAKEQLTFYEITPDFLKRYQTFMLDRGKSVNTISIYLRTLRTIFNDAIANKDISNEIYPFGKRKYKIPASRNVKKALNQQQLKVLFEAKPIIAEQEKAKDFWFLSYAMNGMNIKDIALLKYKNLQDDKIVFYRAKTKDTTKQSKPIIVYLNSFIRKMLNKYGNSDTHTDNYIFPIFNKMMSAEKQHTVLKNFIRFINQHIKNLAASVELTTYISTYWARHSFATIGIRNGMSMEFMQERLGHDNIKTTMNYFAGFEEETQKEFADKLMDFI